MIIDAGAILSAAQLRLNGLPHYPNDPDRRDGHLDHVSCTIQYPNVWNLKSFSGTRGSAHDWMVILTQPSPLWRPGTRFCRRNASALHGGLIRTGSEGFDDMFAGDPKRPFGSRPPTHLESCPTDDQAEVLVPGRLELNLVTGVVVPHRERAERVRECLRRTAGTDLPVLVCPHFFHAETLKHRRRYGPEIDPMAGEG